MSQPEHFEILASNPKSARLWLVPRFAVGPLLGKPENFALRDLPVVTPKRS